MTTFRAFETHASLMHAAAMRIAKAIEISISERGHAFVALSGGSTPEPAYAHLAAMPIPWRSVTLLLVDERFLPPSDADSNEALLRRSLAPALHAGATLIPMVSAGSSDESSERADTAYRDVAIDIAVMGMGADGHTASWFPQSPDLGSALNSARAVISVIAPGAAGSAERLTLTRSALARSQAIMLLITGAQKRALLEDEARSRLPIDELLALPVGVETYWAP